MYLHMAHLKLSVFILTNVLIILKNNVFSTILIDSTLYEESRYCKVKDHAMNYEFDFSGLSDNLTDRKIQLNDHEYLKVQFCGSLVTKCNGEDGYSVCLSQENGQEVGAGREPPKIDITHGKITFNYVGDECNNTHNYAVVFEMQCDVLMVNETAIDMDIFYDLGQCDYYMVLLTAAACPKNRRTDCTLTHQSNHYDLSVLTDLTDNYVIGLSKSSTVVLNVCHSLHAGRRPICEADTAICLIDHANKLNISYKSLGKLEEYTRVLAYNGSLRIDYKDGSVCGSDATRRIQSSIVFVCDLSVTSSVPKYIKGSDACSYKFIWRTIAACSKEALFRESQSHRKNCAVRDPITNFEYDLSRLRNRIFKSKKTDGEYEFGVCQPLRGSICRRGTGVCRITDGSSRGTSGGLANGNLMWTERGPYLNYTNGDACSTMGQQLRRHTILEFACSSNDYLDFLEDECRTVITWNTEVACKRTCALSSEITLEQLERADGNYAVRGDTHGTEFRVNVCRSLAPEPGLNCPYGAAICKVSVDQRSGRLVNETNLGYASHSLRITDNKTVILSYHNGSVCEDNAEKKISSHISFLCFHGVDEDMPKFKFYANCEYHFEWKTRLSCGKVESAFDDKNCFVSNSLGDFWNLTELYRKTVYQVRSTTGRNLYTVNFCGGTQLCNGSFVCDNNNVNYGSETSVKADYTRSVLEFEFRNGSKCRDGIKAQSTLRMICNETAGFGKPDLISEEFCNVVFEWITSGACKLKNDIFFTTPAETHFEENNNLHQKSEEDQAQKSKSFTIIAVHQIVSLALIILLVILAYYFRKQSRRLYFITVIKYYTFKCFHCCRESPQPIDTICM